MRVTIYKLILLCFLTCTIYIPSAFTVYAEESVQEEVTQKEEKKEDSKENASQEEGTELAEGENTQTAQKTTVQTEEVVVSATKVNKDLLDVPISLGVVTQEDIQRGGAKTVGDALKDVPGVELTSDGTQGLKRISIRGEKPQGTLILIDGQRVVENKSDAGTPILIDPSRIERIEVIKGPASVLYGADAMGGVVNIITKKGGTKPIEAEVFAGFNSNTLGFNEGISLFGGYKGFTYRVSVAQNDQGNLTTPLRRVPNTQYSNTDASIYLDYTFLDKYTVGIGYDYYHANIHGTIEPVALDGTRYNEFEANMPNWTRHKVNTFFVAKDITDYLSQLRVDFFLQENTKDFSNIINPYIEPISGSTPIPTMYVSNLTRASSKNINQQIGLSVQTDWLLGDSTLFIVGYEFEYDWLDTVGGSDTSISISMPPILQSPYEISISRRYTATGYSITNALYAQGESSLPQDFILNYGTRLSVITTGLKSHSGDLRANTPIATTTEGKTYVSPVFNFGVMYAGFEDTTLRLTFSQGFRSPTLQERYLNTSAAGELVYANASLKPESSYTVEFGARYFANNFRLDITPFYTFTENYIVTQPVPGGSSAKYENVGKAHSVGIEADLRYTIAVAYLTPYTTVTFIKRQFDYGSFTTWDTGTPIVNGRFGLLYEQDFIEQGFSFYADAFGKYASSTTYTQPDGTAKQTLHVGAYLTANVQAGIRFGDKRQYYIDLLASNILNKRYIAPTAVRQVGAGYLYEPGLAIALQVGARF